MTFRTFNRPATYTLLAASLLAVTPALANDARSFAMGGAGVANGKYNQAASLNPALAAAYEERDNFGLILPAFNFEVSDEDEVFDAVDDFQRTFNELENLLRRAEQGQDISAEELEATRDELVDRFGRIDGALTLDVGGQVALSIPNRFASVQFFADAQLQTFGAPRLDENDVDRIFNATSVDELDNLESEGFVVGSLVTDLGLALARTFEVAGRQVSFGVAPKIQEIESFTYFSSIRDLDEDDFDANEFRSSSSQLNLDVGLTMPLSEQMHFGLTVRNLLSHSVQGEPIFSRRLDDFATLDYELNPHAVAGVGYNTRRMSLSLDADLTQQNYLGLSRQSQQFIFGQSRKTQFVRAGYEYDLGRWIQVRAGYRHDLEGTYSDAVTAGLGVSPFGRVHINLSGSYSDDRNFGVAAQTAFTF